MRDREACQGFGFDWQLCARGAGMTTVRILDHHPTGHINLEAEVNYPEDDGIIQVEHFCIHFSKEGTVRLCWAHHSPALWGARKEC